jgi:2-oxoglutarate dehydrogenase E1 component
MMPSLLQTSAYGFAHKDNFLQGSNANYIDHMYEQWKHDPKSVNASWQAFFATDDFQVAPTLG